MEGGGQRLVLDENRLSQEADNEVTLIEKPATKGDAVRASVCKGNAAESSHSQMVVYSSSKLHSAHNCNYGLSNGIVDQFVDESPRKPSSKPTNSKPSGSASLKQFDQDGVFEVSMSSTVFLSLGAFILSFLLLFLFPCSAIFFRITLFVCSCYLALIAS